MSDNERIIRDFVAAWSRLDASELAEYFTEDGIYHNIPAQPVAGRDNIRSMIKGFIASWTKTDWEVRTLLAAGETVFVERIDRIQTADAAVDLPCVGVFELEQGLIREWRDYFDLASYAKALQG